jgi:integrase
MKIGKRSLDDLAKRWEKGKANGAPVSREVHWDEELKGFGVRRQTVGTGATFVLKYRVKGETRQRWLTLGEWPSVHPEAAREEAQRIKQAAALGRDLVAEQKLAAARTAAEMEERRRLGIPVPEILDAFRLALEQAQARKQQEGRSGAHERELLRLVRAKLKPAVAGVTVGDFDPDSLQAILTGATGHSAALNLRTLLARFLRFGERWLKERGVVVTWQRTFEVTQDRPVARHHHYTLEEAARLWIAAGQLGRRGALVRYMLLTACRRSEAQRLRHEHVVLADDVLGPHVAIPAVTVKHLRLTRVPIPPAAVALLRWLPQRETKKAGAAELVFAGRGNRQVGGWTDILRALLRAAKVKEGWLHDIRRTVVTSLGDRGWDPTVVDRLLNHAASNTMTGVMAVYQRSEQWEQQRRAIEAWAELLLGEVARIEKVPLDRDAWGFTAPFQDARIRRARKPRKLAVAA